MLDPLFCVGLTDLWSRMLSMPHTAWPLGELPNRLKAGVGCALLCRLNHSAPLPVFARSHSIGYALPVIGVVVKSLQMPGKG